MSVESVSAFFTVVLGCLALGAFADKVTQSLRADELKEGPDFTYRQIVGIFYRSTFLKYLNGSAISSGYICRTSLAGIVLLTTVYCAIWYTNGLSFRRIADIFLLHPFFIVPLFVSYLFAFWLTVFQTSQFVKSSAEGETRIARGLYVVADLLTSSNLFIFIYSAGITAGLALLVTLSLNSRLEQVERLIVTEIDLRELLSSNTVIADRPATKQYNITRYAQVDGVRQEETVSAIRLLSNSSSFPLEQFIQVDLLSFGFDEPKFFITGGDAEETFDSVKLLLSGDVSTSIRIEQRITGELEIPMRYFYTEAFKEVDKVEDQFLNLFSAEISAGSVERVVNFNRGFTPFSDEVFCIKEGYIWSSKNADPRLELIEENCFDEFRIVTGTIQSIYQTLTAPLSEISKKFFLLSPAYIAAMLPSLMFYFVVLASVFLKTMQGLILKNSIARSALLVAPFSSFSLLLGVILWFLIVVV